MTVIRVMFGPVLAATAVLVTVPSASAAVTNRAATSEDTPRAERLSRFQESRQGPEHTERVTRTAKVGDGATLDLTNISGDVHVTGAPGSEIRIDAIKRVRHRDENEALRVLGELRVEITQIGDRIEVRTVHPRRSGNARSVSASVDFTVAVPAGAAASVKSISGDVSVTGVRGEVRAETVSGDIDVSGTPNLASARTISGDVRARDIGGASTMALATVSGTVIVTGLKVRALECGSVSGDLRLSGLQVDRVQAKTVSGDIAFEGPLSKGGRYEFTGHSGSIRLTLTGDTGFELDANTFNGSVRSDYPITLRSSRDADRPRVAANRTIRGTYGDGSAVLAVQSFSGSVVIGKK